MDKPRRRRPYRHLLGYKEDQRSVKYFPGTSRHLLIGSHVLVQKFLPESSSVHVIANPARAVKLFIWFLT